MQTLQVESVEHARELVRTRNRILPVGGRTKPLLSAAAADVTLLDCRSLRGIEEYEPTEFTFTAQAGTPIQEVQGVLAKEGQYLPCDPPMPSCGATLGGTIAAGINGSCSLRFGGARDFVLGIRFIDGLGNLIRSGGKVVKNAAGFDLPKFFVGSCGRFGLMTELTLKVFPEPRSYLTLSLVDKTEELLDRICQLNQLPMEFDAIDLVDGNRLLVRIGGSKATLDSSAARIRNSIGSTSVETIAGAADKEIWDSSREFDWHDPESCVLFRVPCQLRHFSALSELAAACSGQARLVLGGQQMLLSIPVQQVGRVREALKESGYRFQGISGNLPTESGSDEFIHPGGFAARIKTALDPESRFSGSP